MTCFDFQYLISQNKIDFQYLISQNKIDFQYLISEISFLFQMQFPMRIMYEGEDFTQGNIIIIA